MFCLGYVVNGKFLIDTVAECLGVASWRGMKFDLLFTHKYFTITGNGHFENTPHLSNDITRIANKLPNPTYKDSLEF